MDKKSALVLSFMDCEKEFHKSIHTDGNGFIIDDSINYAHDYFEKINFDRIKELYSKDSIYSYKFGLTLQDEGDTIKKLYSCKCGQLYGLEHLSEVCNDCTSEVDRAKFKDVGWFRIKPHINEHGVVRQIKTLHPYLCYLLCTEKGGDLLIRLNGGNQNSRHRKKSNEKVLEKIEDITWKDILFNKQSLKDFIIKYIPSNAELLLKYEDLWYTNVLPVISKNFRPISVKDVLSVPKIYLRDLNTEYTVISLAIKDINDDTENIIEDQLVNKLKSIVTTMGNICSLIYEELSDGKQSVWRSDVVAPRVDNSGRLIIEAIIDPTIHDIDVVQLPLDFFRVVFSKDVEEICKTMKMSPVQINNIVDMNYELSEEERLMIRNEIFPKVKHPYVYINREPCIYMTSVLGMRIHSLIDEMVMRVPFFTLPAISGDFDGDALAIINFGTPEKRLRIYETLGIKRSLINTKNITYNAGTAAPNNNAGVLLWKGFYKDAEINTIK